MRPALSLLATATLAACYLPGFHSACAALPLPVGSGLILALQPAPEPEDVPQAEAAPAAVAVEEREPAIASTEADELSDGPSEADADEPAPAFVEPGSTNALSAPASKKPTQPATTRRPSTTRRDRNRSASATRPGGLRGFRSADRSSLTNSAAGNSPSASNSVAKLGYAAFKLIAERNIFNSTRSSPGARPVTDTKRTPPAETLTLVGILCSETGDYAFFDSSSSELRKALSPGKTIAGHRLLKIDPDAVELESGTNRVTLRVGGQLRRDGDQWRVSAQALAATPSSEVSGEKAGSSSADDDDVVKRLMRKREQELK